jgi:hypothetical protein
MAGGSGAGGIWGEIKEEADLIWCKCHSVLAEIFAILVFAKGRIKRNYTREQTYI